jgi:hypothetical protein
MKEATMPEIETEYTTEPCVGGVMTFVQGGGEHGPEQLYIVCRQCGEAFDNMGPAWGHAGTCGSDQGFDLLPESEAF